MKSKKKKLGYGLLGILIFLLAIRIALPYGIKWYLNNRVLNDMDTYTGSVTDVDLALYRGAYAIDSLRFVKKGVELEKDFIVVPRLDLSVQWKALFDGEIVGEIETYDPVINFAFSEEEDNSQTGTEEDWTEIVKRLIPIKINRFTMNNGTIALTNVIAEPATDFPLEKFNLEILNIQNVKEEEAEALPSKIKVSGYASNFRGNLKAEADAMLLKRIPDFDYNLSFEGIDITSLNPLFKHYAGMDAEEGTVSLYSELVLKDGDYEGYLKPIVKDMKIFAWKEENRKLGQFITEFFSQGIKEIFENQPREQFATRIPIEGDLNDPKIDIWTTIISSLVNAYIDAFEYQLDGTVDFDGVVQNMETNKS
ncbi:MAG: DUF748 domain-containing protein [Saprospiraceae bacterium]